MAVTSCPFTFTRSKRLALRVIKTLALGIGVDAAMFSVIS
jgi:hypothetical protein